MIGQVEAEAEEKMQEVIEDLENEFKNIQTGRARPSLVEDIVVNYYGEKTPLNQMAKISAPEARLLVIEPWDKSVIENIEKAIMKEDLGFNPNNDGNVIRINIPKLTEERRNQLSKLASEKAEEARVSIREIRREGIEELELLEDESEISEDNYYRGEENMQELHDQYIDRIDEMLEEKKERIMEV
ncbi:ribosome recycling factor [Halarsenatibacter silvermanii]|uniref:Ribosome-recycling factor n=1 Tax=Halarsenatibacter silvermanii TaxID=321763 RepID=A0A1G9LFX4_9FIRM|nr:ribosome recycling factor [Halarsenatibacter silvermanii]SDL60831.1 ribosome recycling factor [Halarsenatibacter silvermanii]